MEAIGLCPGRHGDFVHYWLRRRAGRPQLKREPLGSTLVDSSVQERGQSPQQRRRLIGFVAVGAALLPTAVLIFRPPIDWPGPPALLWLLLAAFGASLGALLWFAGLVGRATRKAMPSTAELVRDWEAEEQRFAALRARAAQDPSAAAAYVAEVQDMIQELELIVAEGSRSHRKPGGWNAEGELTRLKEDLAWAQKQVGKGAA